MIGTKTFGILVLLIAAEEAFCRSIKVLKEKCTDVESFGKCSCIHEINNYKVKVECVDVSIDEVQDVFRRVTKDGKVFSEFLYSNEEISKLPSKFFKDSTVWKVDLMLPRMFELKPNVFDGVEENVFGLHIKKSKMIEVPIDVINALKNLEDFAFEGSRMRNKLDSSTLQVIERPERMRKLSLSNNGIRTIGAGTFTSFPRLRSVSLRNNKLQLFTSKAFLPNSLENLELDGNRYKEFPLNMLHALENEGWISLSNTEIKEVPGAVFTLVKRHSLRVNLKGNSVKCPGPMEIKLRPFHETLPEYIFVC